MNSATQQPREEWEKGWPPYMRDAFDRWRAGDRGYGSLDPDIYRPAALEAEAQKKKGGRK